MSEAIPSLSDLISFPDFEKIMKQRARKGREECHIKEQKKAKEYNCKWIPMSEQYKNKQTPYQIRRKQPLPSAPKVEK